MQENMGLKIDFFKSSNLPPRRVFCMFFEVYTIHMSLARQHMQIFIGHIFSAQIWWRAVSNAFLLLAISGVVETRS